MINFIFSVWGLIIVTHLAGWVLFTPYMAQSISRGSVPNCRQGNSKEFCDQYHKITCRTRNGVQKNVDGENFFYGTLAAFFWEFTTIFVLMFRRANRPDSLQKEVLQKKDDADIVDLSHYQARITAERKLQLRASKLRELQAKQPSKQTYIDEDEEEVTVDVPDLREVVEMIDAEATRKENTYHYEKPLWMRT